eukprot:2364549-Amphidinium_carterae.1
MSMNASTGREMQLMCRGLLLPVDMAAPMQPRTFIWGEPLLRKYYTVYDAANYRIGFASARSPLLRHISGPMGYFGIHVRKQQVSMRLLDI